MNHIGREMQQKESQNHVADRANKAGSVGRYLYQCALHDAAALENLADAVANLENLASHHAQESKYLRDPLMRFRSDLRDLFNSGLYVELLQRRAAIEQHEDDWARDAERLAPKFAHRVAELKQQFDTGGEDHGSADHEGAGTSRIFSGSARRAVSGGR